MRIDSLAKYIIYFHEREMCISLTNIPLLQYDYIKLIH